MDLTIKGNIDIKYDSVIVNYGIRVVDGNLLLGEDAKLNIEAQYMGIRVDGNFIADHTNLDARCAGTTDRQRRGRLTAALAVCADRLK